MKLFACAVCFVFAGCDRDEFVDWATLPADPSGIAAQKELARKTLQRDLGARDGELELEFDTKGRVTGITLDCLPKLGGLRALKHVQRVWIRVPERKLSNAYIEGLVADLKSLERLNEIVFSTDDGTAARIRRRLPNAKIRKG